ncbi:MAG: hypothetical protein ACJA06_000324 [Halocynthiibacter sp.]|jgi:uncharacterized protein YcbX
MKLQAIHIYPVKSLQGGAHDAAQVAPEGLIGDRRFMVIQPSGRFVTRREMPRMAGVFAQNIAGGVRLIHGDQTHDVMAPIGGPSQLVKIFRDEWPAVDCGDEAAGFLSQILGRDLRLVYQDDPASRAPNAAFSAPGDRVSFADGYPLLATSDGSLAALNEALENPVEMARFRPNLVISGVAPWAEDTWRRIRIGAVEFRVVKPCERCVIVTQDAASGAQADPQEPLETLKRLHRNGRGGPCFGQNLIADGPGQIALGDTVEVLEMGESNLSTVA